VLGQELGPVQVLAPGRELVPVQVLAPGRELGRRRHLVNQPPILMRTLQTLSAV